MIKTKRYGRGKQAKRIFKSVDQVMAEVRQARAIGARTVFFSDDNFLADKAFTGQLLKALIAWNIGQSVPLSFSTRITVEIADDEKLLKACADARFSVLFLGVETVRRESPTSTPPPIAGISLLNAPRNTPLYRRLQKDGRLIGDDFSGEWQLYTNIIPKQMSREELLSRYGLLFKKLYDPEAFYKRFTGWLRQVEYFSPLYTKKKFDPRQFFYGIRLIFFFGILATPPVRALFIKNLIETWKINPKLMRRTFTFLTQYHHFHEFVKNKLPDRM